MPTHVPFELAAYVSTMTQQPAAARSTTVFMYLLLEDQSNSRYTHAHRPVWWEIQQHTPTTTGVSLGGMQKLQSHAMPFVECD